MPGIVTGILDILCWRFELFLQRYNCICLYPVHRALIMWYSRTWVYSNLTDIIVWVCLRTQNKNIRKIHFPLFDPEASHKRNRGLRAVPKDAGGVDLWRNFCMSWGWIQNKSSSAAPTKVLLPPRPVWNKARWGALEALPNDTHGSWHDIMS